VQVCPLSGPYQNTNASGRADRQTDRQIKNTGGDWPTKNETLVNNYLQYFVKFVKSIEFTDIMTLYFKRRTDRERERERERDRRTDG